MTDIEIVCCVITFVCLIFLFYNVFLLFGSEEKKKRITKKKLMEEFETFKESTKEKLTSLENRIKILEFEQENPDGIRIVQPDFEKNIFSWSVEFVHNNQIISLPLPNCDRALVRCDGITIALVQNGNLQLVEVDKENERLIYFKRDHSL